MADANSNLETAPAPAVVETIMIGVKLDPKDNQKLIATISDDEKQKIPAIAAAMKPSDRQGGGKSRRNKKSKKSKGGKSRKSRKSLRRK